MHISILPVLKRCHVLRATLRNQASLKPNAIALFVARNKAQVTMLEEDKFSEITLHSEPTSLYWLHTAAPGFCIDGSKVTILHEPATFYNSLLKLCKSAKKRISFASLYLGVGDLESELVKVIQEVVQVSHGKIKVNFLLDYIRGSRGKQNSCVMLQPLLTGKYAQCCHVFLYHTPKLRGFLKYFMPARFNETIGLQHMKLYMIDDTLIISGANLSNDYFTNRQDRYFVIEDCKDLCDFYDDLIKKVGELSFQLQPDGSTTLSTTLSSHPYKGSKKTFSEEARKKIKTFVQSEIEKRLELNKKTEALNADTWVFPLVQMGQFNINQDSEVTLKLLQTIPPGSILKLATGYFNLTSEYSNAMIKQCQATCHLLTAHPTANGFFSAKGIAGGIPAAYTRIEESFYKMCEKARQQERISLWEFVKPGWTYHAKGLWYFLPGQNKPCLTLIGSPNFGYRSVKRDLETQVAIVTKNEQLRLALKKEEEDLFSCAKPVTLKTFSQEDRVTPAWVRAAVIFFRYFF